MSYLKLFLISLLSLSLGLVGCSEKKEETTNTRSGYYYDPRIPGGQILSEAKDLAGRVLNLTADASQLKKITLNWKVPPIYKTMNYEVKIYKKKGNDTAFVLPDPGDPYSAAPLYLHGTVVGETFLDQNGVGANNEVIVNVEQNEIYTYWVYIKLTADKGEKWSPGVKITVTSKTPADTFRFPSVATFWNNMLWEMGSVPQPLSNPLISLSTMSPGVNTVDAPTGGIAVAYSGNVMYYADTKNNRVIIYTRGQAYKCDDYKITDPAYYYACVYQYSGAPLTPVGVIGQDRVSGDGVNLSLGKKDCIEYDSTCSLITTANECDPSLLVNSSICEWVQDNTMVNGGHCTAYKRCLTKPSKVSVSDNRLFISDVGNNRIVVYYNPITTTNKQTIPVKGHVKDNGSGIAQEIDGSPAMVIGKKGLVDKTLLYPIGKASLKNPGGVTVNGNDLYIADTGNHRVVKIKDYKSEFDCESSVDNWGNLQTDSGFSGGKCSFSGLLGQKTYFERWTFKEGAGNLGPNDIGYDGIRCTNPTPSSTYCDSPYILYNQNCGSFANQTSCIADSACNWIQTSSTTGTCSLKPEATLRNLFDQANPNKPGPFMSRYFRSPSDIMFTTVKNENNIDVENFAVVANEEASVSSPLGTSELRGRILVWRGNPFPTIESPTNPPPLTSCYSGAPVDNFDIPSSRCHADYVVGQENFNQLSIVAAGGDYGNLTYGLKSISGIAVRGKMMFGTDVSNNKVYFWEDFTNTNLGVGVPPNTKVLNPNGRINPNTGRYLPVLKGLGDIKVIESNLLYISDPLNSRVYEIRAYEYETSQ